MTMRMMRAALNPLDKVVVAGFYGADMNDKIRTFSRGGSDVTGSLVSLAVGVDLYENWTDVSGLLAADPRIIENPRSVRYISYRELRTLSYMGASVLHTDAVLPASEAGIPINIRNTNQPDDPGTMIMRKLPKNVTRQPITGVAGRCGMSVIQVEKVMTSDGAGFSAIMLDSGGSSQCDFAGQRITSSRRGQHYILVYLNDSEPEGGKPMVEINAYSKAQDGTKKLSSNFKVSEFACKDGSDAVLVAPRLVMVLQSIRSHFGAAVTINSGYRTPDYNAKVGGVAHSQHCYGTAADIVVKGKSPAQVAAYAREIMPDWGGVGIYAKQGFTHIDVREARADWTG